MREFPVSIVAGESQSISKENAERLRLQTDAFDKVFLEFGSGSGAHLIEQAARNPASAFVGFELRYKRAFRTAEKAAERGLPNLFVARTTALVVTDIYPAESVAGVYVNFPDPWDKKKWKKHRLLNPDFLQVIHSLLSQDGFLSYKTDHEEYYDATSSLMQSSELFSIDQESRDLHQSAFSGENILTEFENLFISKGLPTYYLRAVKS